MDFEQHLVDIRQDFHGKLRQVLSETAGVAVSMLAADIKNPDLNNANVSPDAFMLRANQVGLDICILISIQ